MSELDSMHNDVSRWLLDCQLPMQSMLEKLVTIESPSSYPLGVKAVGEAIIELLSQAEVNADWVGDGEALGVLAQVGNPDSPAIFLTGHMDTVFETGTTIERPYREVQGLAYGPGVADMKAGIVMNCFILMALRAYEINSGRTLPFCVKLLATGDEEIGSPCGRHLIFNHVNNAIAVFNAEPGRISGNVVTSRKGGDSYQITVTGRAAHAGVSHQDGISAIEALARIIQSLHALTDYEAGITTNIGVIQGGTTPNTVAEYAMAKLDVRYVTQQQGRCLAEQINLCLAQHQVDGAEASLEHIAGFLPLEAQWSAALMTLYKQQAEEMGLSISGEFTGGCSDAGWTSSMEIPTLCGTGPVGGYAHTDREYCDLTTMVERAQIVARCCIVLGLGHDLAIARQ